VGSKSIFNVVVFVGDSEFMTDMPDNVMELHGFLPYIESYTEKVFSGERVEKFSQKLRDYTDQAVISEEDHMKNLERNMSNPICPKCGKPMVIRVARKGTGAGSEFWGCPNFPSCRVTKRLVY